MKSLNVYLSNLAIWNLKLHNIHWNCQGTSFIALHQYTESLYDRVFESFDSVAEFQRMRGERPLVTSKEYQEFATIEELPSRSFSIDESISILLSDLELMQKLALTLREEADVEGAFDLVNILEDEITAYKKDIWFLNSMR